MLFILLKALVSNRCMIWEWCFFSLLWQWQNADLCENFNLAAVKHKQQHWHWNFICVDYNDAHLV